MTIESNLQEIWNKDYMGLLPPEIKQRGFNYAVNGEQKDILITGINPSFRDDEQNGHRNFDFREIAKDDKYDRYWSSLKKIVHDPDQGIDLKDKTAYLDIFYFREKEQRFLKRKILPHTEGVQFVVDQLKITQQLVEHVIQPKLIIVKNKESSAYWGKHAQKGLIWMGYDLEPIDTMDAGELFQIKGLLDSKERVSPEIEETNLENTLVLFTSHFQYAPKIKRPTAELVKGLLRQPQFRNH
jgi:hypothetical protein